MVRVEIPPSESASSVGSEHRDPAQSPTSSVSHVSSNGNSNSNVPAVAHIEPDDYPFSNEDVLAKLASASAVNAERVDYDDIEPGMIVESSKGRFAEDLVIQLGMPSEDPMNKASSEESKHMVLITDKRIDAKDQKKVLIGVNLTTLGGAASLEESSLPRSRWQYFMRIEKEGKTEGALVPIQGWTFDEIYWAAVVKRVKLATKSVSSNVIPCF